VVAYGKVNVMTSHSLEWEC